MRFQILNHKLLGDNVKFQESPNFSGYFKNNRPDSIIIHFTAGSGFSSSVRSLCDPSSKASAHLVIGRKGEVAQLINFDTIAWHAGKSSYKGRKGYNNYAIGIELDNAGLLKKQGAKYVSWFGKSYLETEILKAKHRNEKEIKYWHQFTEIQISTAQDVCRILIEKYSINEILGHDEIAPLRKVDPGPAFPIEKIRRRLLVPVKSPEEDHKTINKKGIVKASFLNVRSKSSSEGRKEGQPLIKGSEVEILEEKDGWYKVRFSREGWVYGKYIDKM